MFPLSRHPRDGVGGQVATLGMQLAPARHRNGGCPRHAGTARQSRGIPESLMTNGGRLEHIPLRPDSVVFVLVSENLFARSNERDPRRNSCKRLASPWLTATK